MKIWQVLSSLRKTVLDLMFPCVCVGCQKEGSFLCENCLKKIKLLENQVCPICDEVSPNGQVHTGCKKDDFYLDGLVVGTVYRKKDLLAQAIHKFKYQFNEETGQRLAKILKKQFSRHLKSARIKVVPVPLHPKRKIWRGFNQAEVLADELMKDWILCDQQVIQVDNSLQRVKDTAPQAKLNRAERLQNLRNAFVFKPAFQSDLKGWTWVLLDDVYTTGSTLNECARQLKQNGAEEIWGLALGKGR